MSSRSTTLALLLLAAALGAQHASAAAPTRSRGGVCITGEPSILRDQILTTQLAARLQLHEPLRREKIDVRVVGRVAVLSGNMSSPRQIATAVQLASRTAGVSCVQNFLKVGPRLSVQPY